MQRYAHLFIILPVLLLDRWTKLLVQGDLPLGGGVNVFSWLSIVHWQNRGGLFGIMAHHAAGQYIFLFIPLAIIAALAFYVVACRLPFWSRFSLTFVLSGAIGNMYDRIFCGSVVDFILVSYRSYYWPAFNVADMAITFGIGLWLYAQIFIKETPRAGVGRAGERAS
ncbi:MAG: signal peptidase II [Syntrophorhabdales bacterium]|jgi:signal peptidase II